ncbi:MAG: hypothetical protein WDM96_13485 [Lacunisphaera sp.]
MLAAGALAFVGAIVTAVPVEFADGFEPRRVGDLLERGRVEVEKQRRLLQVAEQAALAVALVDLLLPPPASSCAVRAGPASGSRAASPGPRPRSSRCAACG